jgi:succinate dehydrogenase / fumarate reductase cytochrome b subunit
VKIIDAFRGTRDEVRLNPNVGTLSWFLHRITGLLLLFYLFTHLWVIGSANSGPEAFDARLRSVQTPLFHFLEIGLILVIFFHMVNGIVIAFMDFADISEKHKILVAVMITVFAILAIITFAVMLPRVFGSHPSAGGHV